MSDIIFKDVSLTKRAPAWQFFHSNEDKKLAKCQLDNCSEVINWKNGLSGLSNHLRLIHKKIIKQDKSPSKTPDSKAKKSGIQQFVQTPKTPKTPKSPTNQNPGTSRMNQAAPDPNITISADPVVMKRGRVESCSIRNAKKSRPDSNSITNVESDESLDIDLNETQMIQGSIKMFVSQATPKTQNTHVIRCTPGTSRFQAPDTPKSSRSGNRTSRSQSTRGSMFQPRQASNSVFTFQSSTIDANQTISEDPAIKERGPAQHFNDTFIDDSDIH